MIESTESVPLPNISSIIFDDFDQVPLVEDDDIDEQEDEEIPGISSYRDPPEGYLRLRPSMFNGLPPTIFFEYPPELGIKRQDDNYLEVIGDHRSAKYCCHWERNCIKNAFRRAGFERTKIGPGNKWTSLWGNHNEMMGMKSYNCFQKVNHFPSSWCLGRKDRLLRTLQLMKRTHGSEFDFHPLGFILPIERPLVLKYISLNSNINTICKSKPTYWIMKPVASSCGRGIRVIEEDKIKSIPPSRKVLVQKYLPNPYLIDINGNNYKFDLRIYVLVTCVDPLIVYIYEEGLVRFATHPYSLRDSKNKFAHLTNFSINKKSANFVVPNVDNIDNVNDSSAAATESSKWSLSTFRVWLARRTSQSVVDATFTKINDMLVKTMIAGESEMAPAFHFSAPFRSNCYELFGCDVILDEHLHPILLEVNVSPSLNGATPIDKTIKGKLMSDVFHLVGLYPYDTTLLKKYFSASVGGKEHVNIFGWKSPSVILSEQEAWRVSQNPLAIDMYTILEEPESFIHLLLVEDEISRAKSTDFKLLHPTKDKVIYYLGLYRTARFADHLLARWILNGGSIGKYAAKIDRYVKASREDSCEVVASHEVADIKTVVARSGRKLSINIDGNLSLKIRRSKTDNAEETDARVLEFGRGRSSQNLIATRPKQQSREGVLTASRTPRRARSTPPILHFLPPIVVTSDI